MTTRLRNLAATRLGARARSLPVLAALLLAPLAADPAQAQPFGSWLHLAGVGTPGYARIPHSAALNPTGALTIEAWVSVGMTSDCRSIVGKNWRSAWWVGACNGKLRSYVRGFTTYGFPGTFRDAGDIPASTFTHVAVVFDGTHRRHYVNGELAGEWPEDGPLTTNTDEVRVGSDVNFNLPPSGSIDEVRLWNVARTMNQLRSNLNRRIAAQPGLVALWSFDGNANDAVGPHDGSLQGAGAVYFTFAGGPPCVASTPTALCLLNRFVVTAKWRTNHTPGSPIDNTAGVSVAGSDSGIFNFFGEDNWEVMVKAIDGCDLNARYWIFAASATNVAYRMEVFDNEGVEKKIFFNYPGPPAPALNDTSAFATCP